MTQFLEWHPSSLNGQQLHSQRKDIAKLGMKAMLAATLANLMSAAIAGVFLSL